MNNQKQDGNLPLSGDRLVDTLFRTLIFALDYHITDILIQNNLTQRKKWKRNIYGTLDREQGVIILDLEMHRQHGESPTRTVIHELLHLLHPLLYEHAIGQFETHLWPRLTDKQKQFIFSYIPEENCETVGRGDEADFRGDAP